MALSDAVVNSTESVATGVVCEAAVTVTASCWPLLSAGITTERTTVVSSPGPRVTLLVDKEAGHAFPLTVRS